MSRLVSLPCVVFVGLLATLAARPAAPLALAPVAGDSATVLPDSAHAPADSTLTSQPAAADSALPQVPGLSAGPAPLTLPDCIALARARNLDYQSSYQGLLRGHSQLQQAQAPFGFHMDAQFTTPSYTEVRDTQESIELQQRFRNEQTTFVYDGQIVARQRVPHVGQFQLSAIAQRTDQAGNRLTFMEMSGNARLSYAQDLLRRPGEEISLEQAELGLSQAQLGYERAGLVLEGRVIDAFYGLVQSMRQLEIEEQRLQQARAALELAQRKFDVGLLPEVDALNWRVEMLQAEASYAQAQTRIERSRDQLRQVLGLDLDEPLEVVTEVEFRRYSIPVSRALELGLRQRTDMRQAEIDEQISRLGMQRARDANRVSATLNGGVSLRGRGDELQDISRTLERNQWNVGVEVSLPVVDSGVRESQVQQARVGLAQARLATQQQRRSIVQEIRDGVRNLEQAERQISLTQAALEVAERNYELQQSRFDLGVAQSQDLLDSQLRLTNARVNSLDAVINYQLQLKDLRLATMADLEELAVPAPAESSALAEPTGPAQPTAPAGTGTPDQRAAPGGDDQ
ncbi:MAG: TolC family protein [Candidatus Latescibacterota bacterium]